MFIVVLSMFEHSNRHVSRALDKSIKGVQSNIQTFRGGTRNETNTPVVSPLCLFEKVLGGQTMALIGSLGWKTDKEVCSLLR